MLLFLQKKKKTCFVPLQRFVRPGSALRLATALLLATAAQAADVRDFAPNRPSRSDSPFTVPTGFFQVETDLANYTHPGQVFQALDPTLLYGIGNLTDVEVAIGGLVRQKDSGIVSQGFGDVVVRLKRNLAGDDGGNFTLALVPYIKIPTAATPIGNGAVEGGINAPALIALPWDFGLTVEPEISVLKAASGSQASFTGVVNLGHKIVGDLSGFVEIYAQAYTEQGPSFTFDYGLSYLLTKNVQVDAGANVGLNRGAAALNVYAGLALRF